MPDPTPAECLERAFADGLAQLSGEGRAERIRYVAANRSERWADPEEKVRAELWAELIYNYGYAPERIGFEIPVPARTPNSIADLVIFEDDGLKAPWFVPDLFRPAISRLEKLDDDSLRELVNRVPDGWMTATAQEFAVALMRYNIETMRGMM